MELTWKSIERKLFRGILIASMAASATLMSCGSNGGADGLGSGANNDAEVEDNNSSMENGMETKNENRNGIGTKEDTKMNADTTSNIDDGGTSSKGSGSGVDDRMGTERSGAGNSSTNTDMNTGDINTGNVDSGTGKGTATGSDDNKSRIVDPEKRRNSGPGSGNSANSGDQQ